MGPHDGLLTEISTLSRMLRTAQDELKQQNELIRDLQRVANAATMLVGRLRKVERHPALRTVPVRDVERLQLALDQWSYRGPVDPAQQEGMADVG